MLGIMSGGSLLMVGVMTGTVVGVSVRMIVGVVGGVGIIFLNQYCWRLIANVPSLIP